MTLPRVVIVGRPNVGKSSLLNALCGRFVAIVDEAPGVTRDRISVEVEDFDRTFELIDTGGIGTADREDLAEHVCEQIDIAVACAHCVVFVVDVRAGLHPLDSVVAERLRPLEVPVILAANKADDPSRDSGAYEFTALGLGDPVCVSATHRRGLGELVDRIVKELPPAPPPEEPALRVALLGRRNAGKSTLLNTLAGEKRVIVSEVPGTTRDAVDVRLQLDGRTVVIIDTAGLRKRRQVDGSVEFYSQRRALGALKRCDVALLMIDATQRVGRVEKKLAGTIVEACKPCVIAVNKWDLTRGSGATPEQYETYLSEHLPNLHFAPIVCMSAREGKLHRAAVRVAFSLWEQAKRRVGTGELNRATSRFLAAFSPRRTGPHPAKVYFVTQAQTAPPTFVFFVNNPEAFPQDYRRYLAGCLRREFGFPEVPVRLIFRRRERQSG